MKKGFNENKAGVNAVIGVILMVAITVAIAATVHVYVSGMISGPEYHEVVCGKISYIPISDNWQQYGVLSITGHYYSIQSMNSCDYELLKFAYIRNCDVSLVLTRLLDGSYHINDNSVELLNCGCVE